MRIEIQISEILFDIRNKSHLEVAGITDPEARYRAEAGTEKEEEIRRDIVSAHSLLYNILGRYLEDGHVQYADDSLNVPQTLVYELAFAERRMLGKAQPLADAMHAFLVDQAMGIFYQSVAQGELAAMHSKRAAEDGALVETLVYTKRPPIIRH